jgi:hypothetical protein
MGDVSRLHCFKLELHMNMIVGRVDVEKLGQPESANDLVK